MTRKGLIRKIDKVWAKLIQEKNQCEFCKRKNRNWNSHHIIRRNHLSTRFDLNNGVCLCIGCHFKVHQDTLSSHKLIETLIDTRGKKWYNNLQKKGIKIVKWDIKQLKIIYEKMETKMGSKKPN